MTIEIPVELRDEIQQTDLDRCALRDLMIQILANEVEIPKERWEMLEQDYTKKFTEFEKCREKLEDLIKEQTGEEDFEWVFDYKNNSIEIKINKQKDQVN